MMFRVTYETSDGSVEHFQDCKGVREAKATAKRCAAGSVLNEAFGVTRWFVERGDDGTVAAYDT